MANTNTQRTIAADHTNMLALALADEGFKTRALIGRVKVSMTNRSLGTSEVESVLDDLGFNFECREACGKVFVHVEIG